MVCSSNDNNKEEKEEEKDKDHDAIMPIKAVEHLIVLLIIALLSSSSLSISFSLVFVVIQQSASLFIDGIDNIILASITITLSSSNDGRRGSFSSLLLLSFF